MTEMEKDQFRQFVIIILSKLYGIFKKYKKGYFRSSPNDRSFQMIFSATKSGTNPFVVFPRS